MNKPLISDFTRKCDGPTTQFSKGKLWPVTEIINWHAYYKADWEYRQWLAAQEQMVEEFLSDYKPAFFKKNQNMKTKSKTCRLALHLFGWSFSFRAFFAITH